MTKDPTVTSDRSVTVAGVRVDSFTNVSLTSRVMEMATTDGVEVAVGVNAHVCNQARHDERFRQLLTSATTYADGQSIVWAARLLGGHLPERLATTDVAVSILEAAAEAQLPVYFLGASEGVAEEAARRLRATIPGLQLRTHHGYIPPSGTDDVLEDIEAFGTRILFVGMGDPAQQLWIDTHRPHLPPAILTCGGLFDWLSGSNPRAPRWMIRAGLEWLWRVGLEPRRLGRRYLLGNPAFIAAVLRQRWTGNRP